jgi:hypothetical protein
MWAGAAEARPRGRRLQRGRRFSRPDKLSHDPKKKKPPIVGGFCIPWTCGLHSWPQLELSRHLMIDALEGNLDDVGIAGAIAVQCRNVRPLGTARRTVGVNLDQDV